MQRHHNLQGFKGSKKDNFQKKFGAGGINSFSRFGEPYKQCPNLTAGALICGAGGIRTLVRKWNCYAFYMLIETLVFELSWLFLGPA